MITEIDLLKATTSENYYQDLLGVATKAFDTPNFSHGQAIDRMLNFVLHYDQMWYDIGNVDLSTQEPKYAGFKPLYLDMKHTQLNPDLQAEDYLRTFKDFLNLCAARTPGISPEDSWYKAQKGLAQIVQNYFTEKDSV